MRNLFLKVFLCLLYIQQCDGFLQSFHESVQRRMHRGVKISDKRNGVNKISIRNQIDVREKLSGPCSQSENTSVLFNSGNNYNGVGFDLSKPTFDLFSLRSVRNDALLQYNSLNQSEPLRINIYLLMTIVLLSFPSLSEAVMGESVSSIWPSTLAAAGTAALFVKECKARALQLLRFELELNAELLPVRLPPPTPFASSRATATMKQLRGKKRIIVLAGNESSLQKVLPVCFALGNRLKQADALLIPLLVTENKKPSTDYLCSMIGSDDITQLTKQPWFAEPLDTNEWQNYFETLIDDETTNNDAVMNDDADNLRWFGLNFNGRSFASGKGTSSFRLLEVMGQNLRPTDIFYEPESSADVKSTGVIAKGTDDQVQRVLDAQSLFYDALTTGNLESMKNSFTSEEEYISPEVTEVLNAGGRIDDWKFCLEEGARPANMVTGNPDVLLLSETEAYTTILEYPDVGVSSYGNNNDAALLAIQRWKRDSETSNWKLELHQTIPWNPDTKAGGTLRCDCRGCTALTRGNERRTFGGLIG